MNGHGARAAASMVSHIAIGGDIQDSFSVAACQCLSGTCRPHLIGRFLLAPHCKARGSWLLRDAELGATLVAIDRATMCCVDTGTRVLAGLRFTIFYEEAPIRDSCLCT